MRKIALLPGGKLELQTPDEGIAIREGMVKVRVSACGICGSDLALMSGGRDASKELYFGQEYGVSIDRTCTEGACIVVRLPAIFESREMKLQMNREESDDQSAVG